jgi:hypothetical protein
MLHRCFGFTVRGGRENKGGRNREEKRNIVGEFFDSPVSSAAALHTIP